MAFMINADEVVTLLIGLHKNVTDLDMPLENDEFRYDMADTIERVFPPGSDECPHAKKLADMLRTRIDSEIKAGLIK